MLDKFPLPQLPTHRIYLALFHNVSNAPSLQEQLLARNSAFEYAFIDAATVVSRRHVLVAVTNATNALMTGSLRTPNVHSEIVAGLSGSNNIAEAYRRWGITPSTTDLIVVKYLYDNVQPQPSQPSQPSQRPQVEQQQGEQQQEQQPSQPSQPSQQQGGQQEQQEPQQEAPSERTESDYEKEAADIWAHLVEHVRGTPAPVTDEEIAKGTDWQRVRKYYKLNGVPVLEKMGSEKEKVNTMEKLIIMGMALRGL